MIPSATHTLTTSLSVSVSGSNISILSDSTYGVDNHVQEKFSKFILEILYPDNTTLRYSNYAYYDPTVIYEAPSTFYPSQFSKTQVVSQLGFYDISFYQIPEVSDTDTVYGAGDCFVSGTTIYQVVAVSVDVAIDTNFADTSKYSIIEFTDAPSKYKDNVSVFAFPVNYVNCLNSQIESAACLIKNNDVDLLCSDTTYLQGIEAAIAKKLFTYAVENPDEFSEGEIDNVISYFTYSCADNECCEAAVIKNYTTGVNSCSSCDDEEDDNSGGGDLTGRRWKTSNPLIQVTDQPKQRYFSDLTDVEEDDIISVTVGDVEYSFEIEILEWNPVTAVMTFFGTLPDEITNGDDTPVWIRIQWRVR